MNLSLGGAQLTSEEGVNFEIEPDSQLEILIYGGEVSLRCVARVVAANYNALEEESNQADRRCMRLGIEIVGIDEKSRTVLVDFLARLSGHNAAPFLG